MGLAVGGFGTYVSELVVRGVAPSVAGFGATLFLFGQFAVVWPTDVFARLSSVRLAAAVGLGLGTIGTALGGALSVPVALGGRLVLGLGMGTTFLAAMTYAGLCVDEGRIARLQGLLGATFTLGLAVGIAVTPWAVTRYGATPPAIVAAVPVAASTGLSLSLSPVEGREYRPFAEYVDAFRTPGGIGLGLANGASYGLLIVATTWYTDVLARAPALPATLVLTGFAVATFVGRTYSGRLGAVMTPRRAVEAGLVFLAVSLGLVALALWLQASLLLAVALVLTGAGFGLPFGPLFSLAFASVEADAGVLLVGMTAIGNAVALAYPWLVGQLLEATAGYAAGLAVMALSTAAVVGVWRVTLW
jgi:DHA1 family inner membrane transport protein